MAYGAPGKGGQVTPREVGLHLLFGLGAAFAAGLLLRLIWEHMGLPDQPGSLGLSLSARNTGLKNFISLAIPAAAFIPSLALCANIYLIPSIPEREDISRRGLDR